MLFVLWIPLLLQLVMPVGLLLWLAFWRPQNRTSWWLRVVLVTCYLVAIGVGGMWLVLPWYTPLLYAVALIFAVAYSRSSATQFTPRTPPEIRGLVLSANAATIAAGVALYLFTGWRPPSESFQLSFPLRNGTYLVVNGGGNELLNAHLGLKGERYRPWRGQSFGVDIVKLDGAGLRARGILPSDPRKYAIFGQPLYAPCEGRVIRAEDGAPEMRPPRADRVHMAGNHVILECGEAWILLGHMQKGTVRVYQGENVAIGDMLGRVGNTGNTGEPHLHIHAQQRGTADQPLSGEPLPLRFGERYPVRNARIEAPEI